MKDWVASIRKEQFIYKMFKKDTVYVAFNAAEGPVSKIQRGSSGKGSLVDLEKEELLVEEYADEGTTIEAMRGLMKLVQVRGETPGELRVRAKKLATLVFPEEVIYNPVIWIG